MKKLILLMMGMLTIINCSAGTKISNSNNNEVKMEKILFINGSPNRDGNTAALAKVLLEGRRYETLNLTGYRLNFYGQTLEGDQLDEVIKKMKEADIVVMGSPVYWHNICAEHSRSLSARYIPKRARLGNSSPWFSPRNRKASLKKLKYCCKDVTLQRFESKL